MWQAVRQAGLFGASYRVYGTSISKAFDKFIFGRFLPLSVVLVIAARFQLAALFQHHRICGPWDAYMSKTTCAQKP